MSKELEELRHKNRMEEIRFETEGKKQVERLKHENQMSTHRLRRADINRSHERRWAETYGKR